MVCASFTRTAAAVLRGRVPIPSSQATTMHALCYRVLGNPALAEKGPLLKQWNERVDIPDSWKLEGAEIEEGPREHRPSTKMAIYNRYRAGLRPSKFLRALCEDFAAVWEAYKKENYAYDFTDLLEVVLDHQMRLPVDAEVFVVDEWQDATPLMYAVADLWGAGARYYMQAGDPAQALYSWLGATPEPWLEPIPADHTYLLDQSYRLPSGVHTLAERWLTYNSGSLSEGRTYSPRDDAGLVEHRPLSPEDGEELAEHLRADAQVFDSVMILACCGYQLRPTLAALRDAGTPFHNPYRPTERAWNPLGGGEEGRGRVTSTLARLRALTSPWPHDGATVRLWADLFKVGAFVVTREALTAMDRLTPEQL